MASINDDDFGGFEEANNTSSTNASSNLNFINNSNIFDLNNNKNTINAIVSQAPSLSDNKSFFQDSNSSLNLVIKNLQDELKRTRNDLQNETKIRQELEQKMSLMSSAFTNALKDMKEKFDLKLQQSQESSNKELKHLFEKYANEQEQKILAQLSSKYQQELNEQLEAKLVEYQDKLIKYTESKYEDMEIKIKNMLPNVVRDENAIEKLKLRQSFDSLEKNLKSDIEKQANNYFLSQSELLKEQIKSSMLQEHLIHKDLITNKLDKIQKISEEKRRKTNQLYTRHLSGLNFFVDNAHKQLGILKEVHREMFKNRELHDDFHGDITNNSSGVFVKNDDSSFTENLYMDKELKNLSLTGVDTYRGTEFDDDLLDENLLKELK